MSIEVPGYVLRDRIGAGAASEVWRGEAIGSPGRVVAIKRVAVGADRRTLAALSREAEALRRLSHPSILRLLDVVADGDGVALVTPYATGGSLASWLARTDGGLDPETVADIGARLGSALAAAHNAGLIHRDVKPANVLFDAEGQPLLGDFGTALLTGELAPVTGTAEYLDPALLDGTPPDARTDVYGLGVTLYEALAGVPPYAGSAASQTLGAAARGIHLPLAQVCEAPVVLTSAIERAIRRDPAERFATASEFAGRLDEARRAVAAPRATPGSATSGGPPDLPTTDEAPPPPGPPAGPSPHVPLEPAPTGTTQPEPAETESIPPERSRADPLTVGPREQRPPLIVSPTGAHPGRSATRGFGPSAPQREPDREAGRGLDRRLLIAAGLLAVLVPLGIVLWLASRDDDRAHVTPDAAASGEPRVPAAACGDVNRPAGDGEVLLADVTGAGCSVPVVWDGEQLVVPDTDGRLHRYDLAIGADDVVLMGDWNCDGRDTPGLYRPGSGEVFLFEGFAAEGESLSVTGDPTGVHDGTPTVVTDPDGCDHVAVDR